MKISSPMTDRYYLDRAGVKTTRMQGPPGGGHYDIAREVLGQLGVTAKNVENHYRQMFKLQFARVVEHDDGTVEVEHTRPLTAHQKRLLKALEDAGKQLVYVSVNR
jgi:hypothetical protein